MKISRPYFKKVVVGCLVMGSPFLAGRAWAAVQSDKPGPPPPIAEWVSGRSKAPGRVPVGVDFTLSEKGYGWVDPLELYAPANVRSAEKPMVVYDAPEGGSPVAWLYSGTSPVKLGTSHAEALRLEVGRTSARDASTPTPTTIAPNTLTVSSSQ